MTSNISDDQESNVNLLQDTQDEIESLNMDIEETAPDNSRSSKKRIKSIVETFIYLYLSHFLSSWVLDDNIIHQLFVIIYRTYRATDCGNLEAQSSSHTFLLPPFYLVHFLVSLDSSFVLWVVLTLVILNLRKINFQDIGSITRRESTVMIVFYFLTGLVIRISLVLQNLAVTLCGILEFVFFSFQSEEVPWSNALFTSLFVLMNITGGISRLMSMASDIAVTKDWVIVMTKENSEKLSGFFFFWWFMFFRGQCQHAKDQLVL